MTLRVVMILLVLWVPALRAETVAVRTGEHGGFTRVVLPLPRATEWVFGRNGPNYEIRLATPGWEFDLSRIFDKIDRRRLTGLKPDPDGRGLVFALPCQCHAVAFEARPGLLVVDIQPGDPLPDSPFENQIDAKLAPTEGSVRPRPRTESLPPASAPVPDLPMPERSPSPDTLLLPAIDPRVLEARNQLLMQIGRAAAQGLVETDPTLFAPREPPDPTGEMGQSPPEPAMASDHAKPSQSGPDAGENQILLHAETAFDRALVGPEKAPLTQKGEACLPDKDFDLAAWGDSRPAAEQISERRNALVGEFDKPDAIAVRDLIRLYLYFGFGAEAVATLSAMHVDISDGDLIDAIADIVDLGSTRRPGRLAGQESCSGAVAMWAVLAAPDGKNLHDIDAAAVRRTFSALPTHLRILLGESLSDVFLASGDAETAHAIRDATTRAGGAEHASVKLLEAKLEIARGDLATADEKLAEAVVADGPPSPEATVLLVDARIAENRSITPEMALEIAALAHEYRGTKEGQELVRAHILALASAEEFQAAFEELAKMEAGGSYNGATEGLWSILSRNGGDEAFLRFGLAATQPPAVGRLTRDRTAERFLSLGFPEAALKWLGSTVDLTEPERLLRAEAELQLAEPEAALRSLAGSTTQDAARLRAEALSALGQHEDAAKAYGQLGAVPEQAREAWRAADWPTVARIGTEAQRAVLASQASGSPDAPSALGPLARDRALVQATQKTRGALEVLLKAESIPGQASP